MDTVAAEGLISASWLLIALPLAGAAVLLLGGRRTDRWGHLLGTATVVAAFVLGLLCTVQLTGVEGRSVQVDLFTFMQTGTLDVRAGLLFDPLSALFVLLITGVGALIHVYSIGYMAHDPGRRRFFAYLNLFVAAMLLLVLGNNFVALYVGWEGVGLASYLLIALWHTRPAAATAAKKAFIMNRVGDVVLAVGAVTLLIGAIAGWAHDDIKKVLAYSTVSQIGYMFLAVGLGPVGYVAGLAHLLTHGFFKAGLFLGAGSVMHAMDDDVDMRRFGGLASRMKVTFVTFGLGYLALIGFPFLSGFYTKDAIIEAAFDRGDGWGYLLGGVAILAAGLTAFYMTRLMLMTFFGRPRWEPGVHRHESPKKVMSISRVM